MTTPSRNGIRYPSELRETLEWLGSPPAADPADDLAPLREHLAAVGRIGIPALQYLKLVDLFRERATLADGALESRLLDAALPLAKPLRTIAGGLMDVHADLAAGYRLALHEAPAEDLAAAGFAPAHLCACGLASLSRQYEVAQQVAAPVPHELWEMAEAIFRRISDAPDAADAARRQMKALLALAAAQPENFSPREIAFLADFLREHADAVEFVMAHDRHDTYWLEGERGVPPTACARRPPGHDGVLRYCCKALGEAAQRHLSSRMIVPANRDALARAAERWASPPTRRTVRRRQNCRVQICARLGELWQADDNETVSDWMLLNESPAGYGVMHIAGEFSGLVAGSAVGLRRPGQPWNICVVRWARSDNPEHFELGLELLAAQAQPVRIVWHGTGGETPPVSALLLPPLPALQRGEALLTARGQFLPQPFALIAEAAGRIRIAECSAARLSLHTANIEVFEFARRS